MKKLTAVDILYKFLYEMESFNGFDPYNFNHKELFKQAKAMEKERIIKHSVELCKILMSNSFETSGKRPQELIDSYFSKTFKSE